MWCVSVVRLIVATRSSGPPASVKIIKEMPVSVASGTSYTIKSGKVSFLTTSRPSLGRSFPLIQWIRGFSVRRQNGRSLKRTTHLHLILKLTRQAMYI